MKINYTLTDIELVDCIKQHDRRVYEFVFKSYYSHLCRYANSLINDKDASEDLVQDIFVKLWEKAESVDIQKSLKAYLFRIVHNNSINYIRHQLVVRNYEQEFAHNNANASQSDKSEYDTITVISNSIQELPEKCREVFTLSRIEGLKHKEIAERLNISEKTVEAHITKATAYLKVKLKHINPIVFFILLTRGF